MPKFNDINLEHWKDSKIQTDSLWLINKRDDSGKHSNIYHGNFIPQIPNQLISRFTKENEVVLDLFLGSGTTLFECEKLNRNFIGFDINDEIIDLVEKKMEQPNFNSIKYVINNCDSSSSDEFNDKIKDSLNQIGSNSVQHFILHPPYLDIIKFTNKREDLSSISDIGIFISQFNKVVSNGYKYLENNRYFSVIIGDIFRNGEVIPLSFYLMDSIKRNFKVKLKGIIVKNIEGNKGKLGKDGIWRYRALSSDYYIFKHEYIFVFKKEV